MVPAQPAATIILLRDRASGLEVFMLRRHSEASFMAEAYVFPGGRLEPSDESFPPDLLDEPGTEHVALKVAAIRETFEECGVLLALDRAGRYPTSADLDAMGAATARARLNDRTDGWNWSEWVAENGLTLQVHELGFQSWWITPAAEPKRFDTRFFVAAVPLEQDARHDDIETTHSAWIRPAAALIAAERRDAWIVPPTQKNLQALLAFETAAAAVAVARATPDPDPIMPVMERRPDGMYVTHESFEPIWGREL
jgi:8-oxo-dGTP pyrophosphatase MutT (NUDIX family)